MSIEASDVVLELFLMERDGFRGIRVYRVVGMMILFARGKRKRTLILPLRQIAYL